MERMISLFVDSLCDQFRKGLIDEKDIHELIDSFVQNHRLSYLDADRIENSVYKKLKI